MPTAAPAGETCLKEVAAGRPVASFNSFTSVPHDDAFGFELVEHLRAEGHFALDHDIRGAFDGECLAAECHFVAQRHDVARQVLVKQRQFAHDVVDTARVELLVSFAEFLDRDWNRAVRNPLARR